MSKVIGIDLGTTNSCVSVFIDGEAVVIANSEGSRTTPSVVAFADTGERLVGQLAKRQAITNPEHTAVCIKRLIGRRYDDPEVKRAQQASPYTIVASPNGDAWVRARGKDYSPPEISAFILQKMKQSAEDFLGDPVTEAIITVPAFFNDSQRQATKDAGRIAGLNVLRIINEPTAAALAYGVIESKEGIYAVYDLGGGTFDITVLEVRNGVYEVRSTSGDTYLGGEDFDRRVVDFLADEFEAANGIDLRKDRMALQRLREAAEKAKHELSSRLTTDVNLPFIAAGAAGPLHFARTMERGELENLVDDLVQKTLEPCRDALQQAGVTTRMIDEVILVGGMTRMPMVQRKVAEFFGREPSKGVNPDEVVAIGAAMQGGVLRGEVQDVLLLDVTPLSLGVETQGGVFTPLIARNTSIPVTVSETFTTAIDNQPFVSVHALQGERPLAKDNVSLARFDLVGIPPAPRGLPQIEVTFHIDADGILQVSARDLGTGREQNVRINTVGGLSEKDIDRIVAEAERQKDQDVHSKELADVRNLASGLLYTTERSVLEYGNMLNEADRGDIAHAVQVVKELLDLNAGIDEIREAIQLLEGAAYRLADAMYAQAGPRS
jgi:molecular chaperone DnaK